MEKSNTKATIIDYMKILKVVNTNNKPGLEDLSVGLVINTENKPVETEIKCSEILLKRKINMEYEKALINVSTGYVNFFYKHFHNLQNLVYLFEARHFDNEVGIEFENRWTEYMEMGVFGQEFEEYSNDFFGCLKHYIDSNFVEFKKTESLNKDFYQDLQSYFYSAFAMLSKFNRNNFTNVFNYFDEVLDSMKLNEVGVDFVDTSINEFFSKIDIKLLRRNVDIVKDDLFNEEEESNELKINETIKFIEASIDQLSKVKVTGFVLNAKSNNNPLLRTNHFSTTNLLLFYLQELNSKYVESMSSNNFNMSVHILCEIMRTVNVLLNIFNAKCSSLICNVKTLHLLFDKPEINRLELIRYITEAHDILNNNFSMVINSVTDKVLNDKFI